MASELGGEFVVKPAVHTHKTGEKLVTPELLLGLTSIEKTAARAIDKQARGYFKTIERSFSFSAVERITFSGEDPSAMTIDFLRARLQAQRADYRAEKQRSQQLAQKVLELEQKLSIEVQLRKEAERINRDISMTHEKYSTGSNDVVLHDNDRADTSNENFEEDRVESCAVTTSRSREKASSFAKGDDYFFNGDANGGVSEGHNDGDKGQLRVIPGQFNHYGESLMSLSKQNKGESQSSNQFLHEDPSKDLRREVHAMPSDKDSHNGRWKGNKDIRSKHSSFPKMQRPYQAADHEDFHLLHHEEKLLDNKLEQKKTRSCLMQGTEYSPQQQVEKASLTSASLQNQVSEVNKNDRQQFPLDMGNKEGSHKDLSQDTIVTVASEQHLEGLDVSLQDTCGPISGPGRLSESDCISIKTSEAKDLCHNIEGQTETLTLSVKNHKRVELNGAILLDSETCANNGNSCLNDSGIASTVNISQNANDFYRRQYETLKAKIVNTVEQHEVPNMISNTGKRDNPFGVINGQVFEGSDIKTNSTERELNLDEAEIEGGIQGYSNISGSQYGKQMQGLPTSVGECNESLLSSFKFDVQTEYSSGKLTKEDLVIESSQTRKFMNSSNEEPDLSPVLICNQQNSTQRKARSMGEQLSEYSTERTSITGIKTVETNVSQGQLSEIAFFGGETDLGAMTNRRHLIPSSIFNNHKQPTQDFKFSQQNFPRELTKHSSATDRRDQDYCPQAAHGSNGLPLWMDSSKSAAGMVTRTSHSDVSPFASQRNQYRRLYTRDGEYEKSEFAPLVKGARTSTAEMPSMFASTDRYSRLVSPSGGRSLSAQDRFYDNGVSRPSSCIGFQDDEFSVRRIRGQEIEALESREMRRHLGHRQHPYYFEAERQGRLLLHVSPFTESIEPVFLPLRSAAIPKNFSTLPNEVGKNAKLDLDLIAHRPSVDGGFDRVRQILKALEVAKQHMQTSKEPIELPGHLEEPSVEKAGREGSRNEFPVQYQNPSRFLVKDGPQQSYLPSQTRVPNHPHRPSQARVPNHPYPPSQTRPDERPSF